MLLFGCNTNFPSFSTFCPIFGPKIDPKCLENHLFLVLPPKIYVPFLLCTIRDKIYEFVHAKYFLQKMSTDLSQYLTPSLRQFGCLQQDGNSHNIAKSAQFQLKLPTRAEPGKNLINFLNIPAFKDNFFLFTSNSLQHFRTLVNPEQRKVDNNKRKTSWS